MSFPTNADQVFTGLASRLQGAISDIRMPNIAVPDDIKMSMALGVCLVLGFLVLGNRKTPYIKLGTLIEKAFEGSKESKKGNNTEGQVELEQKEMQELQDGGGGSIKSRKKKSTKNARGNNTGGETTESTTAAISDDEDLQKEQQDATAVAKIAAAAASGNMDGLSLEEQVRV